MTESLRIPGRLLGFYSFPNPRRSREVTHFCSVRVTHQKCGLLIRKSIARVALSSAPKACRWINSHEHTRYVEFSNMQSCERRSRGRQAVRPQSLCIFYALRREAISLSGGRSRPLLSREHTASLEFVGWRTAVIPEFGVNVRLGSPRQALYKGF